MRITTQGCSNEILPCDQLLLLHVNIDKPAIAQSLKEPLHIIWNQTPPLKEKKFLEVSSDTTDRLHKKEAPPTILCFHGNVCNNEGIQRFSKSDTTWATYKTMHPTILLWAQVPQYKYRVSCRLVQAFKG
jgi:hypothetical protein